MSEPREVVVTIPAVKRLTILEVARASVAAGVNGAEAERLMRTLTTSGAADAEPADVERVATLLYSWAWQLVRRDEPGVTWAEAQTWRVVFDMDATDELADAEAEAIVRAAAATGLPPAEAGRLTIAEMGIYAELAESRAR